MPGKIKRMIDTIIDKRSKGSDIIAGTIKIKLIFKGINPDNFTYKSPDNPDIINKLQAIAEELELYLD